MLVDTNIVIYAARSNGGRARDFIRQHAPAVSIISRVEALGYHQLDPSEKLLLEAFFQQAQLLPLTESIADEAIRLRQLRRMSLGDALIAATALTHSLTLATNNTPDFSWINGLTLINPTA